MLAVFQTQTKQTKTMDILQQIKEAIGDKEVDFKLDDFKILSNDDFTTMVEGYKTDIEDTKTKSNKIGREILLKELKDELGFDYEQRKNPENLKKAYIEKFGKPEPADTSDAEERIRLLTDKYTKDLEESNGKYDKLQTSYKVESDNKLIHDALTSSFGEFDGKTHYKTKDLVSLAKANGDFVVIDGKVYQSKDGEPVKNDLLQAITTESFAKNMMLEDGYIKKTEGGRVIGDETKGGKYSMEEYIASAEAQGINTNGLEFAEKMVEDQKSGVLDA